MILLSFDMEEFDLPREHGVGITVREGMEVSRFGAEVILDLLARESVKATFFCTANFALNAPDLMKRMMEAGHEIACHGCDHFEPRKTDPVESKRIVEEVVRGLGYPDFVAEGYRQPRMFPVSDELIGKTGYVYNSSLNPAFIPGRYMHLDVPRTIFRKGKVWQIPVSVTPVLRIPLFWLALHLFPERLYRTLVLGVLRHDGYFTTYFHPWEFYELNSYPRFKSPSIIRLHSGKCLEDRLERLISHLKGKGYRFVTYREYLSEL